MIATIHQPCYMPYLGIFYKIWKSDIFIYLDDAQYTDGYVLDWNKFKNANGEFRLKVPVHKSTNLPINKVMIADNGKWVKKHLASLQQSYGKAPYFDEVYSIVEDVLNDYPANLSELNVKLMNSFLEYFGIRKGWIRSSRMNLDSTKTQRIIDICNYVGADSYISGVGGSWYQDEELIKDNGINLIYTDYEPFEYPQLYGDFIPNMSVFDFAANCGPTLVDRFKEIANG